MAQRLITQLGAFVRETLQAINDNFTELYARPIGGSPAGSDTQVQFNDAGSFGGTVGFTYNKSDGSLTIPGDVPRPAVDPFAMVNIGTNNSSGHESNAQAGLQVSLYGQANSPSAIQALMQLVRTTTTTGVATALYTFVDNESFASAGVIPTMRGIWVDRNTDSGFGVLNNDGIYIDTQQGQATNNFALHIADQGTGAADYAIKVEGGQSVFGGPVIVATHTPSAANDTGVAGQISWDSGFIYICVATNTWKRVAIATWP